MYGSPIPTVEILTASDVLAHAASVHKRRLQREAMAKRIARLDRMKAHAAEAERAAPPPVQRDWIILTNRSSIPSAFPAAIPAPVPTFATKETRLSRVRGVKHAKRLIAWVCRRHGLSADHLLSNRRCRSIVTARHLAIQLVAHSRHCEALSLPDIGRIFGGKDHTTILHACRKAPSYQTRYSSEKYIKRRPIIDMGAS